MRMYKAADWSRLGRAVYGARMRAGYQDTQKWADHAGRSSRTLLGLERGEPVGAGTITAVEEALGWPPQWAYSILNDPSIGAPPGAVTGYATIPTPTVTVGGRAQDGAGGSDLLYRKPEGVSDQEWQLIRARGEAYIQALIDQAATER